MLTHRDAASHVVTNLILIIREIRHLIFDHNLAPPLINAGDDSAYQLSVDYALTPMSDPYLVTQP